MTDITFQPQTPNILGYVFCRPFYRGILIYWDFQNPEMSSTTVWGVEVQITNAEFPTATSWVSCGITQGSSMIITQYTATTPLVAGVLYQFRVRPVDQNRDALDIWKSVNFEGDLAIPIGSNIGVDYCPAGYANRNLDAGNPGISLTVPSRTVTLSYINEFPFPVVLRIKLYCRVAYTTPTTVTQSILRITNTDTLAVLASDTFQVNTNTQIIEVLTGVIEGSFLTLTGEMFGASSNISFGRTYLTAEPVSPYPLSP